MAPLDRPWLGCRKEERVAKRWKVVGSRLVRAQGVDVHLGEFLPDGVPENEIKLMVSEGVIVEDKQETKPESKPVEAKAVEPKPVERVETKHK